MSELAQHDKQSINNGLQNRIESLEGIAKLIKKEKYSTISEMLDSLNRYNTLLTGTENVFFVGDDGKVYKSTGVISEDKIVYQSCKDANGETFCKRYNEDDSKIIEDRAERFIVGVPIDLNVEGIDFFYLVAPFKLSYLESELKVDSFGGAGYSSILDKDGNYILDISKNYSYSKINNFFDDYSDATFEGYSSREEIIEQMHKEDVKVIFKYEGKQYILLFSPIENTDWYFMSFVPRQVFEKQSNSILVIVSTLVVTVGVALLVLIILLFRNLNQRESLREAELVKKNGIIIKRLSSDYERVEIIEFNDNKWEDAAELLPSDSERTLDIPGYDEEKLFTKQLDILINTVVYPDDRKQVYDATRKEVIFNAFKKNHYYDVPFRTIQNDEMHYYKIRFSALDTDDVVRSMVVGIRNIDSEKEAERALEEALTISSYLINSFISAYYINLETHEQSVYLRSDELKEKYDGINDYLVSVNKYIGQDVHPEDRDMMFEAVQPAYIKEKLKKDNTFSIIYRDISGGVEKNYRYIVMRGADENHIAMAYSDVTEEIRNEKEAQTKLEEALSLAQEATEAKSNFLFNMSHDIRTPMNAITGFTNMAIKNIDDKQKVVDCLSKTQQAGNMLLSLINSVLEVSRIESGNATLDENPGDIYYSFENIKTTMYELAQSKDIHLSFEFGEIKNKYVYADFDRCMRIFVNIISNAIKYTNEGGYVRVKCEQISEEKDGIGEYQYTFEDNGIGMSEEFQKHVFDQFSRESTTTVSGIQGSGLGMSVVKSFVDLMGGSISVKSKQGEGSTFTVVLPLKIQAEQLYTDPKSGVVTSASGPIENKLDYVSFNGRSVLLVEDNEMNREIAIEILEEEGMMVDSADDGTTALEKIQERGIEFYDFILMDIQMPIMNGYEATKKIRDTYPDTHIPIIALSANAFAEDKKKSIEAGMDDHVAKPIDVNTLKETLAKFL